MKIHKVVLKKNLIIDTVLASIVVQQAPKLLNQYFFSSSPLTGTTFELAGGAVAYLIGMLFGKVDVANIGIALAGADIVNNMITPIVAGTGSTAVQDYSATPLLKDYTNSVGLTPYRDYAAAYEN